MAGPSRMQEHEPVTLHRREADDGNKNAAGLHILKASFQLPPFSRPKGSATLPNRTTSEDSHT